MIGVGIGRAMITPDADDAATDLDRGLTTQGEGENVVRATEGPPQDTPGFSSPRPMEEVGPDGTHSPW